MNTNSPKQLGVYRTSNVTYVTYYGDGNGRDSYVIDKNGGLRKEKEYLGSQAKSSWNINTKIPKFEKEKGIPRKGVSVIHYQPDGSGRDSYVIKCNGGTQKEYTKGFVDYPREYLREEKHYPFKTPVMDQRF